MLLLHLAVTKNLSKEKKNLDNYDLGLIDFINKHVNRSFRAYVNFEHIIED